MWSNEVQQIRKPIISKDQRVSFLNSDAAGIFIPHTDHGNEIQQMAICAQLVDTLKRLEEKGCIAENKSIMIIPCANFYSMNIGKRFWTMDNTDIKRR